MRALFARRACCPLARTSHCPTYLTARLAAHRRSQYEGSRAPPVPLDRECRRAFWGIFQKPPREIKPTPIEPGWAITVSWRTAAYDRVRPPPREDLVKGFTQFFDYKTKHDVPVNSTQALYFRLLLKYLLADAAREDGSDLNRADLYKARNALLINATNEDPQYHLDFLRTIHDSIMTINRREGTELMETEDFCNFLKGLTQYGASVEAASALLDRWKRLDEGSLADNDNKTLCLQVLQGLAKEGREEELERQLMAAEAAGIYFNRWHHEVMTVFYTDRVTRAARPSPRDVTKAKYWFDRSIIDGIATATPTTLHGILQLGLKTGELYWVKPTFEALIAQTPTSDNAVWDVVLQWAVFGLEMEREEVESLIEELARKVQAAASAKKGVSPQWPTNDTFNGLLGMAIERDDEERAKQAMSMAESSHIAPNTRTYVLLANWMLDKKRPGYAFETYRELRNSQPTSEQFEAAPTADRLLRALSELDPPEFDKIGEVSADLERQGLTLSAETVVALCMAYLRYERNYDVLDTLSLNAFQFGIKHQENISRAFIEYSLAPDPERSTARVWDAWQILTQFFPAIDLQAGRALVRTFFGRKRPDMAVKVFQHMSKQLDKKMRPDTDAYVEFFTLLGHCFDEDALTAGHNMLKLDSSIQWSTKLFNSLMIAYGPSEKPSKALDFWEDIIQSIEGPSFASLDIVLWACAHKWDGHVDARKIWRDLMAREVDVTPMLYVRYVAAIAHSKYHLQEALSLLDKMPEAFEREVDTMTLGIVYNALPGPASQEAFETWASAKHPENWKALEKQGRRRVPDFLSAFKINDRVDAVKLSVLAIPAPKSESLEPPSGPSGEAVPGLQRKI